MREEREGGGGEREYLNSACRRHVARQARVQDDQRKPALGLEINLLDLKFRV